MALVISIHMEGLQALPYEVTASISHGPGAHVMLLTTAYHMVTIGPWGPIIKIHLKCICECISNSTL